MTTHATRISGGFYFRNKQQEVGGTSRAPHSQPRTAGAVEFLLALIEPDPSRCLRGSLPLLLRDNCHGL